MRALSRLAAGCIVVTATVGLAASPSHAVVHELVGQWCSGQGELEPPGLTRPGTKNFAKPLMATGIVQFTPTAGGLLIDFDFDHPAIKIAPTGNIIQIDTLPDGTPLLIEEFVLGDHPAFEHCPRLLEP